MIRALTVNTSGIRTKLQTIPGFVRETAFPAYAEEAKQEILEDTLNKRSPDGTAYPALSPQYAKLKEKLVGNSDPNLRLKNNLLNSLGLRGLRLGVSDDQKKKAEGVSRRRKFLVASAAMVTRARPILGLKLQRFLNGGK